MKRRLGIFLEEDLTRLARKRAKEEGRPLRELIQDALVTYLCQKVAASKRREEAYRTFCERPISISRYLLYVFTEQGVAMLSGVLQSDRPINYAWPYPVPQSLPNNDCKNDNIGYHKRYHGNIIQATVQEIRKETKESVPACH